MSFRSRCASHDRPFFRLLISFRSMLIINRYCHSLEILHLLRSHFSLLNHSLPIILHELTTDEEILLQNNMSSINTGIYLALIKYNERKYQPLMDWTLIPMEIFPEKKFLPKSRPFAIDDSNSFVRALRQMIDYMEEYDKTKVFSGKDHQSPSRSISQISTVKRTYRTKSNITQTLSSPLSALSVLQDVDIRKYIVSDPQRINNNISPFSVRPLSQHEQISYPRLINNLPIFSSMITDHQFNENDLILFKQHFISSFPLDLKNCIHQLAIEQKLEYPEIQDILIRLDHSIIQNELHLQDIPQIIRNLKKAATTNRKETSESNLSNLMRICLRIDQLEKRNQFDQEKVQIFNERIYHLARMGILYQQTKMLKKLSQLDLFENEPNQQVFSQFIHEDLQRIIPKHIPLNALGLKEIIHQLRINIDRLGIGTTLLLIDNLQQINHAGLLLTLNRQLQLKRYLNQFIEHLQTGRCIGVYLQRLIEQMNNSLQINLIKNGSFTNQMNSLLRTAKVLSKNKNLKAKNNLHRLVSVLMKSAYQGQLNAYVNKTSQDTLTTIDLQTDIDTDNLQSLILFLQEQSSTASLSNPLPSRYVSDLIQYLRHFAQLGILSEPKLFDLLTILHRAKDHDTITLHAVKIILDEIKTVNYLYAYHHLNLIELDQFLHDMILNNELTSGQTWYILDRLIDLCRIKPITNYDIKTLLTHLQLEHNRQQPIYPKLLDCFESLAESYSKPLAELHSLERELQKFVYSNNIKRIPEEVRKRLNDILNICKKFRHDRILVEQLFGETMNYKFYQTMKEILKTKNLINRKQSLTAIVQIHKHFTQLSRLNTQNLLSDQQLDLILQNMSNKCSKQQKEGIKHMAKLGYLQEKSFVEYLTKHFLSNESPTFNCREIEMKLQSWPLTIDLNHPDTRLVIKHLLQLEKQDQIDPGTSIEIQNRLNQLARFGKWSSPQVQFLLERILQNHGKKSPADQNGFQSIQSIRLIFNDLIYASELELFIQKLASEHRIADDFNHQYRDFLYRIFRNELSIDELTGYRKELKYVYRIKYLDVEELKRFIALLPKGTNQLFPLTLTDRLFEEFKWDGKVLDKSMRDQLLKFERSGVLSHDTYEEIYNNLSRTSDISLLALEDNKKNQLFDDLFDKINDLLHDGLLELNQSIEIKEQLYLLEEILDERNFSIVITMESRLFNTSTPQEFQMICQELKTYLYGEQFRLSKAQDLISKWHLNEEKGNINEKQIFKLFRELANLNRLCSSSTNFILNRYLEVKQLVHRQLIKDLQRLKIHAVIDKQAIDCIRSIEVQLYKIDSKHRFNEVLIKNLHNRLSEIFGALSRPSDQTFRTDICKKLNELLEIYVKSNKEEYSAEQFLISFDSYVAQMKQGQLRSSKTRYHHDSSETIGPTISPSLQSLQTMNVTKVTKVSNLIDTINTNLFMERKSATFLQDTNDYRLSFLHNILNRPVSKQLAKHEIVSNVSLAKPISSEISTVNAMQIKTRSKKLTKRQNTGQSMNKILKSASSIPPQPYVVQTNPKKIDHTLYVFDQQNSFCPAHVPIKYGFQIRALIENNRLPSWRFTNQDKNQIIYKSSISQNPSDRISRPFSYISSMSTIPKYPLSTFSQIQHRWIHFLLNSGQFKGQNRQLSSVVHQHDHTSPIPTTTATRKASLERLHSPRNCSDKPRARVKRRTRCIDFEEHLRRYYLSKGCLTTSTNFPNQQIQPCRRKKHVRNLLPRKGKVSL